MADIDLSQAEADALFAMEKVRVNDDSHTFPVSGSITVPLQSPNKREQFLLDISRGHIDLLRGKYQNRARQVVILARLDFRGAPHQNPDGVEISCPHLHLYREGYADKWAVSLPETAFTRPSDVWGTLEDFMRFCGVTQPPNIQRGLFT